MQSVNRLRPGNDIGLQAELSRMIGERQQQISTGRKVEKPSQDPAAWSQISNIAKQQADTATWLRNIDRGIAIANQAEGALVEMNTQLARANELLVQASSDTFSEADRQIIANEMDGINEFISNLIAQTNSFGGSLFHDVIALKIPIDENIAIAASPTTNELSSIGPVLANIADVIRTGSQSQRSAMLTPLSERIDALSIVIGDQGLVGAKLEQGQVHLQNRQLEFSVYRSSLEDADITQAITSVQKLLVNLQAAQATYAQIEQTSLFDVIR